MRNLVQQTRQAFYFSLGFYMLAVVCKLMYFWFADVLVSIALFLSLIWILLVLRELMQSTRISNLQRMFWLLFIIFGNVLAGAVYFFYMREKVIGKIENKK